MRMFFDEKRNKNIILLKGLYFFAFVVVTLSLGVQSYYKNLYVEDVRSLCQTGISYSCDSFSEYAETEQAKDYIEGVMYFNQYLQASRKLLRSSEANAVFCEGNEILRFMLDSPEIVCKHIDIVVDYLQGISEDVYARDIHLRLAELKLELQNNDKKSMYAIVN